MAELTATTAEQIANDLAEAHIAHYQRAPHDDIIPSCLIQPEQGDSFIVACPWANAEERRFVLALLRGVMREANATRYAIWSEVWFAKKVRKPKPGETLDEVIAQAEAEYMNGDLSEDPERIEAVYTVVVEPGDKITQRLQRIVRGPDGGVARLELDPGDDDLSMVTGALTKLLPERTIN